MVSYNNKIKNNANCSVLILVVVDDGLVLDIETLQNYGNGVLILVVVDDGLVLIVPIKFINLTPSLNPCCSGRWSRTRTSNSQGNWSHKES